MRLRAGVSSDRGLVRQINEDSYLVRKGLYAVCDGMGGARAGEVASEMACRGLLALEPGRATAEDLRRTTMDIDEAIVRRSLEEDGLEGMGTTLTAALAGNESLTLAHVGDSRAYLLRSDGLAQLTEDHSWVGEMVRRGELTPAQAAVHPHRSVITRVLGSGADFRPDIVEVPVQAGDRILICSDGLTGMVSDGDIAAILGRHEDVQTVAGLLVQAALAGGGEDNVTAVVVDVLPVSEEADSGAQGRIEADEDQGDGASDEETPGGETDSGDERAPEDEVRSSDEDEILLGPSDRGIVPADASGREGRLGAGMRERLGGRIPPLRGPSIRRPVAGASGVGGLTRSTGAARSSEATAGIGPASEGKAASSQGKRWTRRRWLIVAAVVVIVLAILIGAFAVYNSTVYYVGTFGGTVALFRGLPVSILGIDLSSVVELGTITRDSLPSHLQARVDAHDLVSKEDGRLFLRTLGAQQ